MDTIIEYVTGENFYYFLFFIFGIIVLLAAKIGYVAGKAHKFMKCNCEDPEVSDLFLCQKCEKQIEI